MSYTYTKTYALLDAWASTVPHACLVRPTGCCAGPEHDHSPMVDDRCAVPTCAELLAEDEECYAVTQLGRDGRGREQWVCWRHVRPDQGPVR